MAEWYMEEEIEMLRHPFLLYRKLKTGVYTCLQADVKQLLWFFFKIFLRIVENRNLSAYFLCTIVKIEVIDLDDMRELSATLDGHV